MDMPRWIERRLSEISKINKDYESICLSYKNECFDLLVDILEVYGELKVRNKLTVIYSDDSGKFKKGIVLKIYDDKKEDCIIFEMKDGTRIFAESIEITSWNDICKSVEESLS